MNKYTPSIFLKKKEVNKMLIFFGNNTKFLKLFLEEHKTIKTDIINYYQTEY